MPIQGFHYHGRDLYCEETPLAEIAAGAGTPVYVYSGSAISSNLAAYRRALAGTPHEIHFAVKANSSLGVLSLLARDGAGFDIVSAGELYRVVQAGGDPQRTVFSGVGKTAEEIRYALESGVGYFNCESAEELCLLNEIAAGMKRSPNAALRVNPDIDAKTHPYIATGLEAHKFGIPLAEAERIYRDWGSDRAVRLSGVSCHIGSQIFDTEVFEEALHTLIELAGRLSRDGLPIEHLDLGGGLGVAYRLDEQTPAITDYAGMLARTLRGRRLRLMIEPGRSIVGPAGVLLTKVLYRKHSTKKEFIIVDAAMNDLIRPALYQSYHEILPAHRHGEEAIVADVVGPVCETGDFLAKNRSLAPAGPGELLAVCTAGAYGFVLASNYNSRPRPAEVLVRGGRFQVIRRRETFEDLIRGERTIQD